VISELVWRSFGVDRRARGEPSGPQGLDAFASFASSSFGAARRGGWLRWGPGARTQVRGRPSSVVFGSPGGVTRGAEVVFGWLGCRRAWRRVPRGIEWRFLWRRVAPFGVWGGVGVAAAISLETWRGLASARSSLFGARAASAARGEALRSFCLVPGVVTRFHGRCTRELLLVRRGALRSAEADRRLVARSSDRVAVPQVVAAGASQEVWSAARVSWLPRSSERGSESRSSKLSSSERGRGPESVVALPRRSDAGWIQLRRLFGANRAVEGRQKASKRAVMCIECSRRCPSGCS